jgi:dUTP pyrophosphatase
MKTIRIKKLNQSAVIPRQIKTGDIGFDLTAIGFEINEDFGYIEYDTGLAFEIPENHVGLVFPRSSISNKSLALTNSVGVIDPNYRGSIKVRYRLLNTPNQSYYTVGERCCQLIVLPVPAIMFEESNELSDTVRGDKGFGSSNN